MVRVMVMVVDVVEVVQRRGGEGEAVGGLCSGPLSLASDGCRLARAAMPKPSLIHPLPIFFLLLNPRIFFGGA